MERSSNSLSENTPVGESQDDDNSLTLSELFKKPETVFVARNISVSSVISQESQNTQNDSIASNEVRDIASGSVTDISILSKKKRATFKKFENQNLNIFDNLANSLSETVFEGKLKKKNFKKTHLQNDMFARFSKGSDSVDDSIVLKSRTRNTLKDKNGEILNFDKADSVEDSLLFVEKKAGFLQKFRSKLKDVDNIEFSKNTDSEDESVFINMRKKNRFDPYCAEFQPDFSAIGTSSESSLQNSDTHVTESGDSSSLSSLRVSELSEDSKVVSEESEPLDYEDEQNESERTIPCLQNENRTLSVTLLDCAEGQDCTLTEDQSVKETFEGNVDVVPNSSVESNDNVDKIDELCAKTVTSPLREVEADKSRIDSKALSQDAEIVKQPKEQNLSSFSILSNEVDDTGKLKSDPNNVTQCCGTLDEPKEQNLTYSISVPVNLSAAIQSEDQAAQSAETAIVRQSCIPVISETREVSINEALDFNQKLEQVIEQNDNLVLTPIILYSDEDKIASSIPLLQVSRQSEDVCASPAEDKNPIEKPLLTCDEMKSQNISYSSKTGGDKIVSSVASNLNRSSPNTSIHVPVTKEYSSVENESAVQNSESMAKEVYDIMAFSNVSEQMKIPSFNKTYDIEGSKLVSGSISHSTSLPNTSTHVLPANEECSSAPNENSMQNSICSTKELCDITAPSNISEQKILNLNKTYDIEKNKTVSSVISHSVRTCSLMESIELSTINKGSIVQNETQSTGYIIEEVYDVSMPSSVSAQPSIQRLNQTYDILNKTSVSVARPFSVEPSELSKHSSAAPAAASTLPCNDNKIAKTSKPIVEEPHMLETETSEISIISESPDCHLNEPVDSTGNRSSSSAPVLRTNEYLSVHCESVAEISKNSVYDFCNQTQSQIVSEAEKMHSLNKTYVICDATAKSGLCSVPPVQSLDNIESKENEQHSIVQDEILMEKFKSIELSTPKAIPDQQESVNKIDLAENIAVSCENSNSLTIPQKIQEETLLATQPRTYPLPSKTSVVSGWCTFVQCRSMSSDGVSVLGVSKAEESAFLNRSDKAQGRGLEVNDTSPLAQPSECENNPTMVPHYVQQIASGETCKKCSPVTVEIDESANIVKDLPYCETSITSISQRVRPQLDEADHQCGSLATEIHEHELTEVRDPETTVLLAISADVSQIEDRNVNEPKEKSNLKELSKTSSSRKSENNSICANVTRFSPPHLPAASVKNEPSQCSSKRLRNTVNTQPESPSVKSDVCIDDKSPSHKRLKNASRTSIVTRSCSNSHKSSENAITNFDLDDSPNVFVHPSTITNRSGKSTFSRSVNTTQKKKITSDSSVSLVHQLLNARPEDVTVKSPLRKKTKKKTKVANSDSDNDLDLSLEALPKKPHFPQFHQYCNKRFYDFLIEKMKPKYGLKTNSEVVKVAEYIWKTVKEVEPMKDPDEYNEKHKEMRMVLARKQIVQTHWDFHIFCFNYLTSYFYNKAVPLGKFANDYKVMCPGDLFDPILPLNK